MLFLCKDISKAAYQG